MEIPLVDKIHIKFECKLSFFCIDVMEQIQFSFGKRG